MRPRYFYRDPLATVWMAKHFGMQFIKPLSPRHPQGGTYSLQTLLCYANWKRNNVARCYDLHPDSLHLLEPRENDVYFATRGEYSIVGTWGKQFQCDENGRLILNRQGDTASFEIIQRNGLAFHWPEREAA